MGTATGGSALGSAGHHKEVPLERAGTASGQVNPWGLEGTSGGLLLQPRSLALPLPRLLWGREVLILEFIWYH